MTDDELDALLADGQREGRAGVSADAPELVEVAEMIRRSELGRAASPAARDAAHAQMHAALSYERERRHAAPQTGSPWERLAKPLGAFAFQPAFSQVAATFVAFVVLAGVIVGASAAGADVSKPIRALFDDGSAVKVAGAISEVHDDTIVVGVGEDREVVEIGHDTELVGVDTRAIEVDDLAVGQRIELKGTRQSSGNILALRIRIEGEQSE